MNRLVVGLVAAASLGALYLGLREGEETSESPTRAPGSTSASSAEVPDEETSARSPREPNPQAPPAVPSLGGSAPAAPVDEATAVAEAPFVEAPAGGEAMPAEVLGPPPLRRYEDADALAMRRARQIELVTQARAQGRDALSRAEAAGDDEVVARMRGILNRLQIRLDALEAAATSPEPR